MKKIPLTQTTPLYADPDGALRLSGSRVLLDLVAYEFNQGATAEQIKDSSFAPAAEHLWRDCFLFGASD